MVEHLNVPARGVQSPLPAAARADRDRNAASVALPRLQLLVYISM
jgi:hypothetical protein